MTAEERARRLIHGARKKGGRRKVRSGVPGGLRPTGWPITSVALAVHPDQVAEATARNRRHGVNVEYTPQGKAVIPDAGEYRRLRKLEGVVDRDSFI